MYADSDDFDLPWQHKYCCAFVKNECWPFFTEGATKWMKAFTVFTYITIAGDLLDCGFDFRMVYQLAQYDDTKGQAAWLGICTTIALVLELVVKHKMRQKKDEDTAEGGGGQFDMNDKGSRAGYIMCVGIMELTIFYVEDATTLFIWWQTGVYDNIDLLAQANLVTTVISAVLALPFLVYGLVQNFRAGGDGCNEAAWVLGIPAALFAGCLIFWAWFALAVIQDGQYYNCIGECAVNDTLYNTTSNNSLIFLDGEAEAEEQDGSGFLSSTGDAGLNKAVVGVYVVGWIVAVLGGGFATAVAFQ